MYDASNPVLVVLCPMSTRIMALVVSEGYHVVITTNIHVNKMVGRLLKGNITMYASGEGGGCRSMGLSSVASLGQQLDPQQHLIRITFH